MTLKEADNGLNEVVKYVGKKTDNLLFPWKVERVLILPIGIVENNLPTTIDIIRQFNSSSNPMKRVLKDHGYGGMEVDYFVYSYDGGNRIMKLSKFITLL